MAQFIVKEKKLLNIGVIYINNDYGKGYEKIFSLMFRSLGGKIQLEEGFEQNQTDFKSLIKKFKDNKIVDMYLIAFAQEGGNILKQSFEQGYTANWFSANAIEGPEFIKIADKSGEGLIYSVARYDTSDSLAINFNNDYKASYGYNSEMFAANAYDAINLAANAFANTNGSGEQIKTYLYSISGYPGVAGLTSFDKNGDVLRPVMFKIVSNGKFIPLKK